MDEKNLDENLLGDEYYTLTDEDGNELKFELLARAEIKGTQYYAFAPADEGASDEDGVCEYTILKSILEDGEEMLVTIDDDDEFEKVEEYFNDLLFGEADYDE